MFRMIGSCDMSLTTIIILKDVKIMDVQISSHETYLRIVKDVVIHHQVLPLIIQFLIKDFTMVYKFVNLRTLLFYNIYEHLFMQ